MTTTPENGEDNGSGPLKFEFKLRPSAPRPASEVEKAREVVVKQSVLLTRTFEENEADVAEIEVKVQGLIDELYSGFDEEDERKIREVVKEVDGGLWGVADQDRSFWKDIFHETEMNSTDTISAAYAMGLLDNPKPVHIYDLGSREALASRDISLARERMETSATCVEWDASQKEVFDAMDAVLPFENGRGEFMQGDITKCDLPNKEGCENYWMLRHPEGPLNAVMDRIRGFVDGDELPEGMMLMTCKCHCFGQDRNEGSDYPFEEGGGPITKEEWDFLMEISRRWEGNWAKRKDGLLAHRAMKIMDCLRAYYINQGSDCYRARVQDYLWQDEWIPSGRTSGNAIIVERV